MNQYYVSWHTWHSGEVSTPWDFWFLSKGNEYKPLRPDVPEWDPIRAQEAFAKKDTVLLEQIERDYIHNVKLMAFLPAHDEAHAQAQVRNLFPDAQFDKVNWVDADTKHQILALVHKTLQHQSTA